MSFSSRDIIRSFPELSELNDDECDRLRSSLNKTKWKVELIPTVVGLAIWWGWMLVFGKGTDYLERHPNRDLLGYLHSLGWFGFLAAILLGFGTATALAFGIGLPLWRRLLQRAITALLESKSCFWCGYCLTGLETTDARVRCPECGDHSPVRV